MKKATKKANDPSKGSIQNFANRFVDSTKGPIKLRVRARADGNFVLFFDQYIGEGKHKYEFLKLYLVPESGRNDTPNKTRNNKTWEQAMTIKAQRIVDMQNGTLGFNKTREHRNANVLDYLITMKEKAQENGKIAQVQGFSSVWGHLIRFTGKEVIKFTEITPEFCKDFIDYLRTAKTMPRHPLPAKIKNPAKATPLAQGTCQLIQSYFNIMLTDAKLREVITSNPMDLVPRHHKIKRTISAANITFLTIDELQKLIDTPCEYKPLLKNAFLFSCSTGLRWSDVTKLTWGEVRRGDDPLYGWSYNTHIKKVNKEEYSPIPELGRMFLPLYEGDDNAVIFPIKWNGHLTEDLMRWTKKAGITRRISFHVSRHTAATLNLTLGADITTVSKLLGHARIVNTMIYAEVLNEAKKAAADRQSGIFKFDQDNNTEITNNVITDNE